jgi:hypothetical protein
VGFRLELRERSIIGGSSMANRFAAGSWVIGSSYTTGAANDVRFELLEINAMN